MFGTGNSLTKAALVRLDQGVKTFVGWHHVENACVADISWLLKHYPIVPSFREKVEEAVRTGRYGIKTTDEYMGYWRVLEGNPDLNLRLGRRGCSKESRISSTKGSWSFPRTTGNGWRYTEETNRERRARRTTARAMSVPPLVPAPCSVIGTGRAPSSRESERETAEQAKAWIRDVSVAADEPGCHPAGHGDGVREEVTEYQQVAAPEMLAIHHALADAVVHVEALELLGGPPVVVPDDEVRLVSNATPRPEPAIGEVVVFGGGTDSTVEAAEVEDVRAT
jgi:hypothetical protein